MPRKPGRKLGGSVVEVDAEDQEQELVGADETPASRETFEQIEFLKEKVGDGEQGRVAIQRRLPDGTLANLPSLPVKTFDIDLVAEKYGGGKYEVRFYKGSLYCGYESFTIDPSIQPKKELPPEVRVAGAGEAPTWLAAVLDKMGDAIKAMADRKPEPLPAPIDPMAMIRAIGETMKALTPAPAPALPPGPGLKDQIDMIKSVVEVGTTILDARSESGGGGSGDDYMNTVSKLAEPITDLVRLRVQQETDRRRFNPAARPRVTQPSRNAVTGSIPVAAQPGGQPVIGVPAWLVEVQKWVPMIVKRARGGKSAEDTAFFILDELSEPTVQALAAQAAQPDFGAKLAQLLPAEMQQHPEWVTEFMAAMHDWLFGGDEGAASGEGDDEPEGDAPAGDDEGIEEVVEEETPVFDIAAEAQRRMARMQDNPEKVPATEEPVPV